MRRGPTVLAYHAIGECSRGEDPNNLFVTTERFSEQMDFLRRRRNVVTLEAIVSGAATNTHDVAITFDDGYRSVLTEAAPVLENLGFPATVFVPTAHLGARNTWDPPSGCDFSILTPEELRKAETSGISVESHGHSHMDLSVASPDDAAADIATSVTLLEEILGRRPRFLAYPYGLSSGQGESAAYAAGLTATFSIDRPSQGSCLGRVQVTSLDGAVVFALKTSGRYLSIRHSPVVKALYAIGRPVVRMFIERRRPS